jgi:hypothetical protein
MPFAAQKRRTAAAIELSAQTSSCCNRPSTEIGSPKLLLLFEMAQAITQMSAKSMVRGESRVSLQTFSPTLWAGGATW